jgi:hypothetical protein
MSHLADVPGMDPALLGIEVGTMITGRSLMPEGHPIERVDIVTERQQPAGAILATEDPAVIRQWAVRHGAEPATGEASASGPATVNVQDGDAGIRFNFPAAGRFRPITWDEWFRNFHDHNLVFIYEGQAPDNAPSARYRLIPKDRLEESTGGLL